MDDEKKDIKITLTYTKVILESLGEVTLKSISGNDTKVLFSLLKLDENGRDFTISFLHNQIVSPKITIEEFKKIHDNDLMLLASEFVKNEYSLSDDSTYTTEKEFFENFKDVMADYLKDNIKSIYDSLDKISKINVDYLNILNTVNLIPKIDFTNLNIMPKIDFTNFYTIPTPSIDFSKIIAKPFIDSSSLASISEKLFSNSVFMVNIIPQIDIWKNWTTLNTDLYDNLNEIWEKFENRYKIAQDEAIKCFKRYKWFITPFLPIDFIYSATEICKKGGNQRKAINELFKDYFTSNEYEQLEELVESWKSKDLFKPRMKILRDCVNVLKEAGPKTNASNLVIPTLITQIDAIQREFMENNDLEVTRDGLKDSDGNILKDKDGKKIYWKDWFDNLTNDGELLDSANDIFLSVLFQGSKTGQPLKTPFTFSRHKILHGEYVKYGRIDNTIRSFLILDFLASLMEDQEE